MLWRHMGVLNIILVELGKASKAISILNLEVKESTM